MGERRLLAERALIEVVLTAIGLIQRTAAACITSLAYGIYVLAQTSHDRHCHGKISQIQNDAQLRLSALLPTQRYCGRILANTVGQYVRYTSWARNEYAAGRC